MKTLHNLLIFNLLSLAIFAQCGFSLPQDDPSAQKFPVYVNNTATIDGHGSKDAPFQTLQEALESITGSFFKVLNNSYEILLASTALPYTFGAINIASPRNLSIDLRTMDSDTSNSLPISCGNYAQINFTKNFSNASFDSITSLNLSSMLILNPLTGYTPLTVMNTDRFELSRVCINISDANVLESPQPAFYIHNTTHVTLESVIINRTSNLNDQQLFKIEAAEELILNCTEILYADITELKLRFSNALMTFQNSKKVIIDNMTFALIVNTCIENSVHISNISEVILYNIKVEELKSGAISDKLISIDNLFEFTDLINLTIKYVQLTITAGINNQMFYLRNVQMTEIQHVSFNECTFRSPNRNNPYLFTYIVQSVVLDICILIEIFLLHIKIFKTY